jgi:hypothetical protein
VLRLDQRHCSRRGRDSEGEHPKKEKSQESQGYRTWRNPTAVHPNRQRDQTPEARPLRQRCLCAESAGAPIGQKGQNPRFYPMSRSLGRPILGRCNKPKARQALCLLRRSDSQSQEGKRRREVSAISVRSSSEGSPRKRAWLKGHQGVRRGSNAPRHMVSAMAQRDPGRQSLGVVDLDGWVALGAENLVRVRASVRTGATKLG